MANQRNFIRGQQKRRKRNNTIFTWLSGEHFIVCELEYCALNSIHRHVCISIKCEFISCAVEKCVMQVCVHAIAYLCVCVKKFFVLFVRWFRCGGKIKWIHFVCFCLCLTPSIWSCTKHSYSAACVSELVKQVFNHSFLSVYSWLSPQLIAFSMVARFAIFFVRFQREMHINAQVEWLRNAHWRKSTKKNTHIKQCEIMKRSSKKNGEEEKNVVCEWNKCASISFFFFSYPIRILSDHFFVHRFSCSPLFSFWSALADLLVSIFFFSFTFWKNVFALFLLFRYLHFASFFL